MNSTSHLLQRRRRRPGRWLRGARADAECDGSARTRSPWRCRRRVALRRLPRHSPKLRAGWQACRGDSGRTDAPIRPRRIRRRPATYRSPFEYACRPVSLGFLTAGEASGDDKAEAPRKPCRISWQKRAAATATAWAHSRPGLPPRTCATTCRVSSRRRHRGLHPCRPRSRAMWRRRPIRSPSSTSSPRHSSAMRPSPRIRSCRPRESSPFEARRRARRHLRPDGSAPARALGRQSPAIRVAIAVGPFEPPTIVDRDGTPAMDAASGLAAPGYPKPLERRAGCQPAAVAAQRADCRPPTRGVSTRMSRAHACWMRPIDSSRKCPHHSRVARPRRRPTPRVADDVLAWMSAQSTLGDPGPQSPVVIAYPDSGRQVARDRNAGRPAPGIRRGYVASSSGAGCRRNCCRGFQDSCVTRRRRHEAMASTARSCCIATIPNGDGRIDAAAGEHLWLLFALGRGGNRYYALDVARPDDPRLLWSWQLPDAGVLSLAEPVVTRLADRGQRPKRGRMGRAACRWLRPALRRERRQRRRCGRRDLHVLDAPSGRPLWSAGDRGDLRIRGLASLPSAPRALDLDGDRLLDRAYALDVIGSLWRFDFTEWTASRESSRPRSGSRASAPAGSASSQRRTSRSRRSATHSRIAIAAGSGWITRPRDTAVEDRMYVVFDRALARRPRANSPMRDLYDATAAKDAMPPGRARLVRQVRFAWRGRESGRADGHLRPCAALHDLPAAAG